MKKILVCVNYRANPDRPSCAARGSKELARCLQEGLAKHEIDIKVEHSDCLGYCDKGPNLKLSPLGRFFHHGHESDIPSIVQELKKIS
jgi:NADH:ubiquinone oxidoreductase subunit E